MFRSARLSLAILAACVPSLADQVVQIAPDYRRVVISENEDPRWSIGDRVCVVHREGKRACGEITKQAKRTRRALLSLAAPSPEIVVGDIAVAEEFGAGKDENQAESWYWGFGLGLGKPLYSGAFKSAIETMSDQSGVSRQSVSVDLGFYWTLSNQLTVIGPGLHSVVDQFSDASSSVSLNQGLLSARIVHSLGKAPFDGFFVRAETGLATLSASVTSGSLRGNSDSKLGFGLGGGGGYGFALSSETRLIVETVAAIRLIGGERFTSFAILLGPNF